MEQSYPNINTGRKTVSSAGTAVRLVSSNTPCRKVEIQALPDNTDNVAIGDSNVLATSGSERGVILSPNGSVTMYVSDLYALYVDAAVSSEGVSYTYFF